MIETRRNGKERERKGRQEEKKKERMDKLTTPDEDPAC